MPMGRHKLPALGVAAVQLVPVGGDKLRTRDTALVAALAMAQNGDHDHVGGVVDRAKGRGLGRRAGGLRIPLAVGVADMVHVTVARVHRRRFRCRQGCRRDVLGLCVVAVNVADVTDVPMGVGIARRGWHIDRAGTQKRGAEQRESEGESSHGITQS